MADEASLARQDDPAGSEEGTSLRILKRKREKLPHSKMIASLWRSREEEWKAEGFALQARAMLLAGLPLRPTKERHIVHENRLGNGSRFVFSIKATEDGIALPHGDDALLALFLVDRAISREIAYRNKLEELRKTAIQQALELQSSHISGWLPWTTAEEYFDFIGVSDGGKNFVTLRARWQRLSECSIKISYQDATKDEFKDHVPFVRRSFLPGSIDPRERKGGAEGRDYFVQLDPIFIAEATERPVPLPISMIRELKGDPLTLRLAIFLGYRSFAGRTNSVVPWNDLQGLLGSSDKNIRLFRYHVRQSLDIIRQFWRELNSEVAAHGLLVGPSARPLFPECQPRLVTK